MRDSARYAWWLLIFLFSLLTLGNIALFWRLFRASESPRLQTDNARMGVEFMARYALALEQFGQGKPVVQTALEEVFNNLDEAFAPYEAAVYRAILESAFGVGDPQKTLQSLPDLPSETLSPLQRRWQALRWQEAFSSPLAPEQVPALLHALPDTPSMFSGELLKVALYRRAGDVARADALRESLGRAAGWAVVTLGAVLATLICSNIGGLVVLIVYFYRRLRLPSRPAPTESPFVYDPLLWALVIFLLTMLNAPVLEIMLRDFGVNASNAIYLLAMLLPLMYLASLQRESGALGQIRWFGGAWWKQVGAGLAGYAAYMPFLSVLFALTLLVMPALPAEQTHPLGERAAASRTALQWLWLFAQAAVLAPIIEEFMFRGVLFKVLWQRTGRVWLSAFVSGYLFAVIHPQFLSGVFQITVLGTILALIYAHTRSLLPCILIHALNNGLITLMLWSVGS